MPKRIQRRRTPGFRLPPGTICCTRPGPLGNPFAIKDARDAGYRGTDEELGQWCVELFTRWLNGEEGILYGPKWEKQLAAFHARRAELAAAEFLACWCGQGKPCHVDAIIQWVQS